MLSSKRAGGRPRALSCCVGWMFGPRQYGGPYSVLRPSRKIRQEHTSGLDIPQDLLEEPVVLEPREPELVGYIISVLEKRLRRVERRHTQGAAQGKGL